MTDIVLSPITSGYNVSKINLNFTKIANVINNEVLHLTGGNNTMQQDLDMNNNALLNVRTNMDDPESLLTVADGDLRYYNIDGDTLEGTLNAGDHFITGLPLPVNPTDAVRKQEFDAEVSARVSADQSLQDQLNGTTPPMASAFSEISWHGQNISNSIVIPDNVNAWSFGPTMTVDVGQTVTIGTNSFWTVANGEVQ